MPTAAAILDHETVSDLDIPCWIWIQQIRRQLLERRACTGSWKPLRPRDVHLPATRPQSRIRRAAMPPTVSARSPAEANLFSRMCPRAAAGRCDRTVRMPAPCPSRIRAAHATIARFHPRANSPHSCTDGKLRDRLSRAAAQRATRASTSLSCRSTPKHVYFDPKTIRGRHPRMRRGESRRRCAPPVRRPRAGAAQHADAAGQWAAGRGRVRP